MIKDEFGNRRFFGLYRGIIQAVDDPTNKGRVKVTIPQVLSDQTTSWVWVVEESGIPGRAPKVGQGVWMHFEGGDPSFPVCVGYFGETTNPWVIDCGEI
jgi:hypothetical protein